MVRRVVVSLHDPKNREVLEQVSMPEHTIVNASLVSGWLVSAGQKVDLSLSVRFEEGNQPGDWLIDARQTPVCKLMNAFVPVTWDYRWIPSTDPLQTILGRVAQHEREFPMHGTNCMCMDGFIRDIRAQVSKVLPAMPSYSSEEFWKKDRDRDVKIRARMNHVLRTAIRDL